MFKIIHYAKIELIKYIRYFTVLLISFSALEIFFLAWIDLNEVKGGDFGIRAFQFFNTIFISMMGTAVPITLVFNISSEFSSGYAAKLISNGLPRVRYFFSKYVLASALALTVLLIYIVILIILYFIADAQTLDITLFTRSALLSFLISLFFSSIIISITFWVKSWQYALLIYYAYYFLEGIVFTWLRDKFSFVKYLPMQSAISLFRLKYVHEELFYYAASAIVLFLFITSLILMSYKYFNKSDLIQL